MKTFLPIIFVLVFSASTLWGQGCSDAGACSVGSLNYSGDSLTSKSKKVYLSFGQSLGVGEKFILISQSTVGVQYNLFKTTTLELSVPFIFTYGSIGSSAGIGDLLLSVNQELLRRNGHRFNLVLAGRLKTNNADFTYRGNPLPMAYQTSLGTNDAIAGVLYTIPNWDFYAAYQHSFGRNNNGYLVTDTTLPDREKYYESAQLKRGDDLYLRVRRELALKNGSTLVLTVLGIYRLQQDEIIKNDRPVRLDGSSGLTLNLGVTWAKTLRDGRSMELQLAFPIIEKAYRADGLTRNALISIRFYNL